MWLYVWNFELWHTDQSLGHDIDELNISRSSIRRGRQTFLADQARFLKDNFQSSVSLVIHWDEKLLEDLTGNEQVERLPVIVSGAGVSQLLRVPKLISGTGEAQACVVSKLLVEWRLVDRVKAMCFNTTASNTGHRNGACVLLEQKLNKDMRYLACHHHIFEIVLASVFKESIGMSSGLDIAIFKRFQQSWKLINQSNFETGAALKRVNDKDSVISFAIRQIEVSQHRDDYLSSWSWPSSFSDVFLHKAYSLWLQVACIMQDGWLKPSTF